MPVYEWAKVPTGIGRHKALENVTAPGRFLFTNLLIELWGQEPLGHFTYQQAMNAVGARRSILGSLRSLVDNGLICAAACTACTRRVHAEGAAEARRDAAAQIDCRHLGTASTFVINDYDYWWCGGWAGQPGSRGSGRAIKRSDAGRSPSRAHPREEMRRETTDRTPTGSVRSVDAPGAAPRDARSAARRQADVVRSSDEPSEPVLIGEIVGHEIATRNGGDARGSETPAAKAALAQMRERLDEYKRSGPHSSGRDAYLGNPEWKRHREQQDRLQRAAEERLGYLYTGKVPPPPPEAEWETDPAASEMDADG